MSWMARFTDLVGETAESRAQREDALEVRAARLFRQGTAASKRGDHSSAFWLWRESGVASARAEQIADRREK